MLGSSAVMKVAGWSRMWLCMGYNDKCRCCCVWRCLESHPELWLAELWWAPHWWRQAQLQWTLCLWWAELRWVLLWHCWAVPSRAPLWWSCKELWWAHCL